MWLLRKAVTGLALVAGLALFALTVLVVAGVVMRYGFNNPLTKANDWSQLLMLVVVGFGLAYCGLNNAHVAIDMLAQRLSKRVSRVMALVINLLSGALLLLVAWQSVKQGRDAADMEQVTNLAEIPLVWFFMLGALGIGAYALVLLWQAFAGVAAHGEQS